MTGLVASDPASALDHCEECGLAGEDLARLLLSAWTAAPASSLTAVTRLARYLAFLLQVRLVR